MDALSPAVLVVTSMITFGGQNKVEQVAVEMPSWELCKREEKRFYRTDGFTAFCIDRRPETPPPRWDCENGWCCRILPKESPVRYGECEPERKEPKPEKCMTNDYNCVNGIEGD